METVTVKQIHSEFEKASDLLYRETAKRHTVDLAKLEKAKRLEALGFTSSSECVKLSEVDKLPVYYRRKYPFLKFITEEQLESICEKYGLIYAMSHLYIGEIPEKNLREIENVQLLDSCDRFNGNRQMRDELERKSKSDSEMNSKSDFRLPYPGFFAEDAFWSEVKYRADNIWVAANKEKFDLKRMKNIPNTHGYSVKDPIVFRYVKGGIQIISKWGDEANDTELVVPKLN
jgi:hypothetical protein